MKMKGGGKIKHKIGGRMLCNENLGSIRHQSCRDLTGLLHTLVLNRSNVLKPWRGNIPVQRGLPSLCRLLLVPWPRPASVTGPRSFTISGTISGPRMFMTIFTHTLWKILIIITTETITYEIILIQFNIFLFI